MKTDLSPEQIREFFDCDCEKGILRWKKPPSACVRVGAVAGGLCSQGYLRTHLFGAKRYIHRLVWTAFHGSPPTLSIDHIDRDKTNNAIGNLRLASQGEQCANTPRHPRNTSGFRGVCRAPFKGQWYAYIRADGRTRRLGTYPTAEEAYIAYRQEMVKKYGAFFHDQHPHIPGTPQSQDEPRPPAPHCGRPCRF